MNRLPVPLCWAFFVFVLLLPDLAAGQTSYGTKFRYDEMGNLIEIIDITGQVPQAPTGAAATPMSPSEIQLSSSFPGSIIRVERAARPDSSSNGGLDRLRSRRLRRSRPT
jgi:YD repeat-containing protein